MEARRAVLTGRARALQPKTAAGQSITPGELVLLRTARSASTVDEVRSPLFARLAAVANSPRPRPKPVREFHVPAEQLPQQVLDRLRHPSAPTYLVTWDRTAHDAVFRPSEAPPR